MRLLPNAAACPKSEAAPLLVLPLIMKPSAARWLRSSSSAVRDAAGCARRRGRRNYQRSGVESVPDWQCIRRGRNSGTGSLANWAARTSRPSRDRARRRHQCPPEMSFAGRIDRAAATKRGYRDLPHLVNSPVKARVFGNCLENGECGNRVPDGPVRRAQWIEVVRAADPGRSCPHDLAPCVGGRRDARSSGRTAERRTGGTRSRTV